LTGGGPKVNEGVGAGAGDEFEEDAFGLAVRAEEVAGGFFAPLFACSERATLSFLRCILANEFRAFNASTTWALFGRSRSLWNKEVG
jgi:hypothetical protein